jgi:predicted RNase H-like HicB family nuclease
MYNHKEILQYKDGVEFSAMIEEFKRRRAERGVIERPPFDPEEAQKLYEKYKAKQLRHNSLPHTFLALFEPMDGRGFRAVCPAVENCTVEAPTREEAKVALIKAIKQRLRARIKAGESVPAERGSAEMIAVMLGEE